MQRSCGRMGLGCRNGTEEAIGWPSVCAVETHTKRHGLAHGALVRAAEGGSGAATRGRRGLYNNARPFCCSTPLFHNQCYTPHTHTHTSCCRKSYCLTLNATALASSLGTPANSVQIS